MLNIRFAQRNDTKLILQLINELAVYEKLDHEVKADEKEKNCCGDNFSGGFSIWLGYTFWQ